MEKRELLGPFLKNNEVGCKNKEGRLSKYRDSGYKTIKAFANKSFIVFYALSDPENAASAVFLTAAF